MLVNNKEYSGQLMIYENATTLVEIDKSGIRIISRWNNRIVNRPEIISIYEEGKQVRIVVDGEEFAVIDNFKLKVL